MLVGTCAVAISTLEIAGEPDWIALGLVLSVLGSLLLGNAILFRNPRTLVEEFFGSRSTRLPAIRDFVFHRAQVAVGFTFLVGGFGLQILGRYLPDPARAPESPPSTPGTIVREFPAAWVGAILVLTLGLLGLAWWWARHSFRRHVREHLRRDPPDFEADLRLAREVGDLFGIASEEDDTVESYLERLHSALDLPPPARRALPGMPHARMEDLEGEDGV